MARSSSVFAVQVRLSWLLLTEVIVRPTTFRGRVTSAGGAEPTGVVTTGILGPKTETQQFEQKQIERKPYGVTFQYHQSSKRVPYLER